MDWIEKDGVREQDNFKNLVGKNDPTHTDEYIQIDYSDPASVLRQ